MKCRPTDTYANNCSGGYRLYHRELFAYNPRHIDGNIIRDARWWNTPLFFRRMYKETAGDFRFCVKPKTQ